MYAGFLLMGERWYKNGETDSRPYRISLPDDGKEAAEGEIRYIYRFFLWAPDVKI